MKTYLWYSKGSSVTGKALADELGLTRTSPIDKNRGYGTLPPPVGVTHCINYGARVNLMNPRRERRLKGITYLNNPFEIEKYQDKYLALDKMENENVDVPYFTNSITEAMSMLNNDMELIGRTRRHFGGKGFKHIHNNAELNRDTQSHHWLEYVDSDDKREYRVHVFEGEVIKVQRKKPMLDEDENEIEPIDYVCRSHDNGWRFSNCDTNRVHESIKREALRAVSALGYDFGAVDIIRCPNDDVTKVLEINSGMGLDTAGLELYGDMFDDWLDYN